MGYPPPAMPPDWTTWPYHRPGSALRFPRDEGWHQLLPAGFANPSLDEMEWVYLNAHLVEQGGAGRRFVVFAAYFTQHLRFLVVRAFDAADTPLGVHTGTAWGPLIASPDALDLTFTHGGGSDTWRTRKDGAGRLVPFESHLSAVDDARTFRVELDLASTKAPYDAGGVGAMPFGRQGSFFYYSLTRLRVEGTLHLPRADGTTEDVAVRGMGWYDHQWGNFYVTPFRGSRREEYEWMSIQLDSGEEILLTTVWEPDGRTPSLPAYGGAGLVRADGSWDKLVGAQRWQRTEFWESPRQHGIYAAGWRFLAPEWGADLVITPRVTNQMTPIIDAAPPGALGAVSRLMSGVFNYLGAFWEGSCRVTGTFAGAPVTGFAFAELIKRYERPQLFLEVMRDEPGLLVMRWRVTNPDDQVPLAHRWYVERADGSVLAQRDGVEVPVAVLDDPALPRNEPLIFRVVASSADGTLSGSAATPILLRA